MMLARRFRQAKPALHQSKGNTTKALETHYSPKGGGSSTPIATPSHEVPTLGLSTRRLERAQDRSAVFSLVSVYSRKAATDGF
jgi:hypothetical protein